MIIFIKLIINNIGHGDKLIIIKLWFDLIKNKFKLIEIYLFY